MLQKFFYSLYTAFIALFDKAKPLKVPLALYKQSIFNPVGLWTLVMTAGFVLIFYYVFNGQKFAFLKQLDLYKPKHWWMVLLLVAGVASWLAYFISIRLGAAPEQYLRYFIIVNALVGSAWFFLLSLIPTKVVKRYSYAKVAPF